MAIGDAKVTITNGLSYNSNWVIDTQGLITSINPKDLGFHLVGQSVINHTQKQRETVSYIEKDGEDVAPMINGLDINVSNEIKFPREAFDYELNFIYFKKNNQSQAVNYDFESKINLLMRLLSEGGVTTGGATKDTLQIRNEYSNTKLIGYFKDIKINEYSRKKYVFPREYVDVSVIFRIPKPNKCNFKGLM